jgi:hypothetical protein
MDLEIIVVALEGVLRTVEALLVGVLHVGEHFVVIWVFGQEAVHVV